MTDGSDGDDGWPDGAAGSASDGQESGPDPGETGSGGGFSRVPDDDERAPDTDGSFRTVDGERVFDETDGGGDADRTGGDAGGGDGTDTGSPADADSLNPDDGDSLDDRQATGARREYDRPARETGPDRDVEGVVEDRLPDGVNDQRDGSTTDSGDGPEDGTDGDHTESPAERDDEPGGDDTPTSYVVGDNTAGLDDGEHDPDAPLASDALVDRPTQKVSGDGGPPGASPAGAGGGGGGASASVGTGTGTGGATDDGEGLLGGAPDSDEEMPLTEHIEEMMRRLGAVFAVGGAVTFGLLLAGNYVASVPNTETLITFLWDAHVGFDNYRPYVYGPLELLLTKLKVAGLAGVVAALPVFVYQTYRFMRPGLYPNERRYYLAAVPTSLVLALVGVAFAHFIVLPAIFQYFIGYTEASAQLAFGLKETFNLILLLMGYMAVVFQIPLFIQLATMMGVVSREWLEQRRLLFWGSFLGISFVVSPDPTGMSPIIVAVTMVVLFEGTLALLRWTSN